MQKFHKDKKSAFEINCAYLFTPAHQNPQQT